MRRFGRIPNGGYSSAQVRSAYARFGIDDSFISGKEIKDDVGSKTESSFSVVLLTGGYKALADKVLNVKADGKDDPLFLGEPIKDPKLDVTKTFLTLKDSLGAKWGRSFTYSYGSISEKLSIVIAASIDDASDPLKTGFSIGEEFYLFFNYSSRDSIIEVPVMFVGVNTASTEAKIEIKEFTL
tara:strand:- start:136 stop:684 length:549 start_codon:yes stop_codon:yes gene_type:complete